MRRIKLNVAYNGAPFHGWQKQQGLRTVQGDIETALQEITGEPTEIFVAGRTDAGVHALGQVAHFDTNSSIDINRFQTGINHFCAPNIVVNEAVEVPEDFHARHSATMRHYVFKIYNQRVPSPFWQGLTLHEMRPLDIDKLNAYLKEFTGEIDCNALRSSECQSAVSTCFIKRAEFIEDKTNSLISLHISANHFLHNMIRITVGTLLDLHHANAPQNAFIDIVKTLDRTKAGATCAPHGLYLADVDYA